MARYSVLYVTTDDLAVSGILLLFATKMPRGGSHRNFDLFVSYYRICFFTNSNFIQYFRYHVYKQNQIRLNNNNSTRVDLNNVNRPAAPAPAVIEAQENVANDVNESAAAPSDNVQPAAANENEPLVTPAEPTVQDEPQVPLLTIVRTFVLSFFSSIIPEAPAL